MFYSKQVECAWGPGQSNQHIINTCHLYPVTSSVRERSLGFQAYFPLMIDLSFQAETQIAGHWTTRKREEEEKEEENGLQAADLALWSVTCSIMVHGQQHG